MDYTTQAGSQSLPIDFQPMQKLTETYFLEKYIHKSKTFKGCSGKWSTKKSEIHIGINWNFQMVVPFRLLFWET